MVDSFPPPTSYTWDITTSTHQYTLNTTVNTIQHTLHTTQDYGTLSCTASNLAGVNTTPCQVNIIPLAPPTPPTPPSPPTQCVVDNLTDTIISIQCLPGQQATHYKLHILDNNNTPSEQDIEDMEDESDVEDEDTTECYCVEVQEQIEEFIE